MFDLSLHHGLAHERRTIAEDVSTHPRLSRHCLSGLDQISPVLRTIRKTGVRSGFGILVEQRRIGQARRIYPNQSINCQYIN
jgi:hypothetical protein